MFLRNLNLITLHESHVCIFMRETHADADEMYHDRGKPCGSMRMG